MYSGIYAVSVASVAVYLVVSIGYPRLDMASKHHTWCCLHPLTASRGLRITHHLYTRLSMRSVYDGHSPSVLWITPVHNTSTRLLVLHRLCVAVRGGMSAVMRRIYTRYGMC